MANGTTADQVADTLMGASASPAPNTPAPTGNRADQVADQILTAKPKSTSGGVWDFLNKPLISSGTIKKAVDPLNVSEKTSEKAIAAGGHPILAGASAFTAGAEKSVADLASSFTSPASLALLLASGGESLAGKMGIKGAATALRIPQLAGAVGYGVQGAEQAVTPKQPGETTADAMERRLFGASAAFGGAAGTMAVGKDAVRRALRNRLGLNDDLATKVSDNIAKKQAAEQKGAASQKGLKTKVADLEAQKLEAGRQIIANATQTVMQEQSKFNLRFRDLDSKVTEPVSSVDDVANLVKKNFTDKGITESEIPPSALRALKGEQPEVGKTGVRLTQNELQTLNVLYKEGARGEDLRGGLANMGYAPKQIDAMMQTVGEAPKQTGDLSSSTVTRIRSDLWEASDTAKDAQVKAALRSAYNDLSDVQEKAFDKVGAGKEYRAAKNDYSVFKRGLGSDLFNNLLSAYDAQDQDIAAKLPKFTNASTAGAVRSVLSAAGIDVSPLDDITKQLKDTRKAIPEAARATRVEVKEAEAKGSIIPGKSSSDLAGIGNDDLLRERLKYQADHMRSNGIGSPYALFNVVYGLMQLAGGSPWGAMHIGRGAGMTAIPDMVQNPEFQDWVLRESGVEPSNKLLTAKLRKGLAGMYPMLRKAVASGLQEQATSQTAQQMLNQ